MSDTAAGLDGHAAAYTKSFPHFEENRIVHQAYGHRISRRLAANGARAVLSLGIGHSEVALPILRLLVQGALSRYVVVDAAPAIIEGFRQQVSPLPPGLELVEQFFEQYSSEQPFDAIEAGFVLEHVESPAVVLRRMRAMVAPSGCMFAAVPNARSLHRLLGHEAGLLPDLYRLSDADLALGHRRYFDLPKLESLVQSCGWRVTARAGLLLKPFTTAQMSRLDLPDSIWCALQLVAEGYPEISNAFCVELAPA